MNTTSYKKLKHVSVLSIAFFAYTAVLFMPEYFTNNLFDILDVIVLGAAVLQMFKYKHKPSAFVIVVSAYFAYLVLVSFILKIEAADIRLIGSRTKMIIFIMFFEFMFKRKRTAALNILIGVLTVYVLADFFSIVLFPQGLYITKINSWVAPNWLFGGKNSRAFILLLLMAALYAKSLISKNKILITLMSVVSFLSVLIVKSMTSLATIFIAAIGIVVVIFLRKDLSFKIRLGAIYITYIVFFALLMIGSVSFLRPLVEQLFKRDMTFTSRTTVWATTWLEIGKNPIFGTGVLDSETASEVLNGSAFFHAHNGVLNVLWQGGIVALLILIVTMIMLLHSFKKLKSNNVKFVIAMFVGAMMVQALFESAWSDPKCWYFMTVLYLTICSQNESDLQQNTEVNNHNLLSSYK